VAGRAVQTDRVFVSDEQRVPLDHALRNSRKLT
jgi:hypothetical protein